MAALFTGVKAETTETRSPDLEAASGRHNLGPFLYNDCAAQSSAAPFEVLGWSACARARQPFVRAPLPTPCKHHIEENEAEQYGELTAVNRWKKTLLRMGHEVSNGHITSEDKGGTTREKPIRIRKPPTSSSTP